MVISHVAKGNKLTPAEYDATTSTHNPPYPGVAAILVPNSAPANLKSWASWMQAAGHPVWLCDNSYDEVQINAAFTYLRTTPGILWICGGDYNLGDTDGSCVEVNLANHTYPVHVTSYGARFSYQSTTAVEGCFYFRDNSVAGVYTPAQMVSFEGGEIVGNSYARSGICISAAQFTILRRMRIRGFSLANWGYGVRVIDNTDDSVEYVAIEHCTFGSNRTAILFGGENGGCANAYTAHNEITLLNASNSVGIDYAGLNAARSVSLNDVIHYDTTVANQVGISVRTDVTGLSIINPGFDTHASAQTGLVGIKFLAGSSGRVKISNPQMAYSAGTFSLLNEAGGTCTIDGDGNGLSNSGTGTIANGATSAVITHGLEYTPRAQDIIVTLKENPTNTPGAIWIDTFTATQFTVNCENDPGASALDFAWAARRS